MYALGLVLYEIFTGTRFVGTDLPTLVDLDPLAADAILRCLDTEPERRPASPALVAAALPGGDPVQAALAAGEMPSPEMIAASGTRMALGPALGMALLVFVGLMIMAGAWLRTQVNIAAQVSFENPPEVLSFKARQMLAALDYPDRARDTAYGFTYNYPLIQRASHSDAAARHLQLASDRGQAVLFWYRESPSPMVAVAGNRLDSNRRVRSS
jgi:serine/threonine-protein kinase